MAIDRTETAAMMFADQGEACTYWNLPEVPGIDPGTATTAVVINRGHDARFDEGDENILKGEAMLNLTVITLPMTRPGCLGWLEDASEQLWTITSIIGRNPAFAHVRMEAREVRQAGSILDRTGRRR